MAKKTYVTAATQQHVSTLDDQTLLMSFTINRFGETRRLDDDDYDVHAADTAEANDKAKHATKASKLRFVDFPELQAVNTYLNVTKHWFRRKALPSFLREGLYRVHVGQVDALVAAIDERRAVLTDLLNAFEAAYPAAVARMATLQGKLHNPRDYPTATAARAEFGIEYRFMAAGVPAALAKINDAVYREQQEQYVALLRDTEAKYSLMMREAVADLVGHMVGRLTPNPDGTRKRLHATVLTNFREFVETFPFRNVVNDQELAALVGQLDALFAGVPDVDVLKDDDDLRARLVAEAAAFKTVADRLVVEETAGRRRLAL